MNDLSKKLGSLLKQFDQIDEEGEHFKEDFRETYKNLSNLTRILRESPPSLEGGLVGEIMKNSFPSKKVSDGET